MPFDRGPARSVGPNPAFATPAAQAALAAGVATPAPDGSLVFTRPSASTGPVQREADGGGGEGGTPVASAAPPASPSGGAASATGAAPAVGGLPQDDKALDEFVRRAYGRISDQLRYQLLIDRERAGMLTDLHG